MAETGLRILIYVVGVVVGWGLGSSIRKWWIARKYAQSKKDSEFENDLKAKTQKSFARDGVAYISIHTAFASLNEQIQITKWWNAAIEGKMTWQEVAKEVKKIPGMNAKLEIVFQ